MYFKNIVWEQLPFMNKDEDGYLFIIYIKQKNKTKKITLKHEQTNKEKKVKESKVKNA